MRRIFSAILFLLPFCATAGPGDTTFVQAHNNKWLDYYNNFDTVASFPSGTTSYRKVLMTFTLGKYQCPGNPQYCGDWDYTVHTYLMTPTGDTVELGRLITPYASSSYPRTPLTWKQRYTFDVTDYAPLLKNNATIRIKYSGYSGGFTANVRFAFIEGTPVRNVTGVKALWNGDFSYGHGTPIDTRIAAVSQTPPTGTQASALKFLITGHGFDNSQCSEFCSKNYTVLQNGTAFATRAIWRADCGLNHLYPQSGTWIYDRGNWCPGDQVAVHSYALPSTSSSSVDVDFEPHTSTGSSLASYSVYGGLVHYGAFNKMVDASIDDIITPSNHEQHFRQNPTCNTPMIRVSNGGSTPLTAITFQYGVNGGAMTSYTWNGTLAPLRDTVVTLPRLPEFRTLTGNANTFSVRIMQANNATDADSTNNRMTSTFTAIPTWTPGLRIVMKSNNVGGETGWKIFSSDGTLMASETGPAAATVYTDTVQLQPGCYRMEVSDAGCDGLAWWANPAAGTGNLNVYRLGGTPLTLTGYFGGDFGCGFTQYFTVAGTEASVQEVGSGSHAAMQAVPNPASSSVQLVLSGLDDFKGTLVAVDALGRIVHSAAVTASETTLDVSQWPVGVYTLTFRTTDGRGKLNAGVVVTR